DSKCLATGTAQGSATIGTRRPDGTISWAIYTAIPLPDIETGAVRGAIVTFVDISQRRRAEQELRASEERFQLVVQATGDAIWDRNLVTNQIWRSEGYKKLFGYDVATVSSGSEWWEERI